MVFSYIINTSKNENASRILQFFYKFCEIFSPFWLNFNFLYISYITKSMNLRNVKDFLPPYFFYSILNIEIHIKVESVSELRKRQRNRKRTLHRGFLCLCLITHAHSSSRYVGVTPINEGCQCACLIRTENVSIQRSLSIPISNPLTPSYMVVYDSRTLSLVHLYSTKTTGNLKILLAIIKILYQKRLSV